MENESKNFGEIIEKWIEEVKNIIKPYSDLCSFSDFSKEYLQVLENSKNQIREKKLNETVEELNNTIEKGDTSKINPTKILNDYVDAFAFRINEKDIFLPSFSDECLKELTKSSSLFLSPFRGLYYGWKLGEVYRLFGRGKDDYAVCVLLDFMNEVELAWKRQTSHSKCYDSYIKIIESSRENLHSELKKQIELLKKAMRDIVFKVKAGWIGFGIPYTPLTSTHFYLSGIRFYLYPLCLKNNVVYGEDERLYVQSTDSGLFKMEEHYGIILNSDDPDAMAELLEHLPPGCLMLDLSTDQVTDTDKKSVEYFERWSHLMTIKTYHVVSETLNMIDISTKEKSRALFINAKNYYMKEVRKNPLRKIYFDTGIFQALQLAKNEQLPKISYLTTNKSKVESKYQRVSSNLLKKFLEEGIEYYLLEKDGWTDKYRPFENLTLIPYGENIKKRTSSLISIRGETGKIAHGVDFYSVYLFTENLRSEFRNFRLEDFIPLVFLFTSDIDIVSIVSTTLPFLGRFIQSLIKVKDINKHYQALNDVRKWYAKLITDKNINLLLRN